MASNADLAGCGKTISVQRNFDGLHVWDKKRTPPQDNARDTRDWAGLSDFFRSSNQTNKTDAPGTLADLFIIRLVSPWPEDSSSWMEDEGVRTQRP